MKLFFAFFSCATFCLHLTTFASLDDLETIENQIIDHGYYEFENKILGSNCYDELYSLFDQLIDRIESSIILEKALLHADNQYACTDDFKRLGNAPIGYVNDIKSKKTKKIYFHYTREYYKYLKEKFSCILEKEPLLNSFLMRLSKLDEIYENFFENYTKQISQKYPKITEILKDENNHFAVLLKIVRYEPSAIPASNPHFDFSGLSILADNSDEKDHETLLISPFKMPIKIENFKTINRKFNRKQNSSSCILIPGLALNHLGVPIPPTPHAVLSQKKPRYSIIAFAMAQNTALTYDQIKLRQLKLSIKDD
jgi:hypothetical protein